MVFIIDFWLIYLAFTIASGSFSQQPFTDEQATTFFIMFGLIWIIAGFFNKIYRLDSNSLTRTVTINLAGALLIHVSIIGLILLSTNLYAVSATFLAFVYGLSATLLIGFRVLYKLVAKYYQFSGFDQRKVVIIGATRSGFTLYEYFVNHEPAGYQFTGFFDLPGDQPDSVKQEIVGGLDAPLIKHFCLENGVGEIYFALPGDHHELLKDLSKFADDHFIYFRIAADFGSLNGASGNVFMINSVPVVTSRKEPLGTSVNATLKRGFDIVFSLLVITILFPFLLPVLAIAIRLDSRGPIFFKQLRPGKRNKLFDCYKLRTMKVNTQSELQATKNDSRITRVGRFLRKSNLDELPQFFNVLLGNMSVVGPRPNMISQLDEYSKTIDNYKVRHFVTPGITGFAQVSGFRGETKEKGLMEKRVQLDVQYIENWSLGLDLKIIFLTVWNMVKGEKNAY
jgi:putative colanic acid biosynthesis UDP-glucose lipid carrier transferase